MKRNLIAVTLVVLDGVVQSMAWRVDSQARPALRLTLVQTDQGPDGHPWTSEWPCGRSNGWRNRPRVRLLTRARGILPHRR